MPRLPLALACALLVVASGSCRLLGALPCSANSHCPFQQVCAAGVCVAAPAEGESDAGEGEGEPGEGEGEGDAGEGEGEGEGDGSILEVEPNDDGTHNTGGGQPGNDFDLGVSNGPFSANVLIRGAISPQGDEDTFAIRNDSSELAWVTLETGRRAINDCGGGTDAIIIVRGTTGRIAAIFNDSSICTHADTVPIVAGETLFTVVKPTGDAAAIDEYRYRITFRTDQSCGNGRREVPEACDDGNAIAGDLCAPDCTLEVAGTAPEGEPNEAQTTQTGGGQDGNDFATGLADGPFTSDTLVTAAIDARGDEDVFAVENPTGGVISIVVTTHRGGVQAGCVTFDSVLNLRRADGTLVERNDDGPLALTQNNCSRLVATLDAFQTAYVHVVEFDDNDAIASYELSLDFP